MDYFTEDESDAMLVLLMDTFNYIHDPVCTLKKDIYGRTLHGSEEEMDDLE
jgi:hypothetical protein